MPGRAATFALVLWSGYVAAWAAVSESDASIAAVWWLAGVTLLETVARVQRRRSGASD